MVKAGVRLLALLFCLGGCAAREGAVFVVHEGDASDREDAGADAGVEEAPVPTVDSATDALGGDATPPSDAGDGAAAFTVACRLSGAESGFYDTFAGTTLGDTWLVAHGVHSFAGSLSRGGFVRDNVAVREGVLVLSVRGDRYAGPVRGIDANGALRADGKRSAAAVVTRDLYASGTYQVQGRFVAPPGVEFAAWVMGDDDRAGGADIAVPGSLDAQRTAASYNLVRMRSRSARDASRSELHAYMLGQSLDDGQSHILRFDWYSTGTPSVQFWVDDTQRWGATEHVLDGTTRRLFIVAWLPDDAPADFETAEIRVENAFVTPFGNSGDRCTASETKSPGLVAPR